jgi:hypothetical protein
MISITIAKAIKKKYEIKKSLTNVEVETESRATAHPLL